MKTINEGSTGRLILRFYDKYGRGIVPESVRYRIDDVDSNDEVREWTEITPESYEHTLLLTRTDNDIIATSGNPEYERRRVTIEYIYNTDEYVTDEIYYRVRNLYNIDVIDEEPEP